MKLSSLKGKRNDKNLYDCVVRAFLFVFLFSSVLIPYDTFYTKKLSCAALLVLTGIYFLRKKRTMADAWIIFLGGAVPLWYTLDSVLKNTDNISAAVGMAYPGFLLLIAILLKGFVKDYKKYYLWALKAESAIIVLSVYFDIFSMLKITENPILSWYARTENAMIGRGSYFFTYYMVFIKTSPLLLILLFDSLKKGDLFWAVISALACYFSGTRANVFVMIALLVIYLTFFQKQARARMIFVVAATLICLLFCNQIVDRVITIFLNKASSDATRDGHLQGMFVLWRNKPSDFFFGTGFGSSYYSYGTNRFENNVELSYWDMIRRVGLTGFLPFMATLLYPIAAMTIPAYPFEPKYGKWKLWTRNYDILLPYIGFLLISYTNPFLYSTTGFSFLILLYSAILRTNETVRGETGRLPLRALGSAMETAEM